MNMHIFGRVDGKLARWDAGAEACHEQAIESVRADGVKGPILALIEGGPPQIVVPTTPTTEAA